MGYKDVKSFAKRYLTPLCEAGKIQLTIPERPTSRNILRLNNLKDVLKTARNLRVFSLCVCKRYTSFFQSFKIKINVKIVHFSLS